MWNILGKVLAGLTDKILPDRAKEREAQQSLNEKEIEGAPASSLRLWRSFLGWVLAWLFVWEVAGRMILIPLLAPQWQQALPPAALDQIMTLLLGMLGLCW